MTDDLAEVSPAQDHDGALVPNEVVEGVIEHAALSKDEAVVLTEHIRSTGEALMSLLARAHQGRAHLALGYNTFEEYVTDQFQMSRSRAYQLLSAEKVRIAIESAAPDGTDFRLTEAAARDLKTVSEEVVRDVAARTQGVDAEEAGDIVEEIILEHRTAVRERDEQERAEQEEDERQRRGNADYSGGGNGDGPPQPGPVEVREEDPLDAKLLRRNVQAAYDLYISITSLRDMPSPEEIVAVIPAERRFQINDALRPAVEWLTAFLGAWEADPRQQEHLAED